METNTTTVRAAKAALLSAAASAVLADANSMICDPTRAQMARALGVGPLAVSDLAQVIGRSRTVTSQHLRVLREAGLVEARRQGRVVVYRLTEARAVEVAQNALEAAVVASRSGRRRSSTRVPS